MKMLLDTQAFLWFVTDDARLSSAARVAIEDPANQRVLSLASVWEMAIKLSIGKLSVGEPLGDFIRSQTAANFIEILPVKLEHVLGVAELSQHHKDPFDRLIVVQAQTEAMALVSSDEQMDRYGVSRVW